MKSFNIQYLHLRARDKLCWQDNLCVHSPKIPFLHLWHLKEKCDKNFHKHNDDNETGDDDFRGKLDREGRARQIKEGVARSSADAPSIIIVQSQ